MKKTLTAQAQRSSSIVAVAGFPFDQHYNHEQFLFLVFFDTCGYRISAETKMFTSENFAELLAPSSCLFIE